MKKLLALMVALVLVCGMATVASAAEYPSKGISVICPWGAGGGTDACLRAFCEALSKQLGVTLTVDNRTGGGGIIGHQAIADAEPDGYTMGMISGNTFAGRDDMEIEINGNDDRIVITSRFDNLGKGASGAAIECMNIALGLDPTTGLNIGE